ncbi:MAG: hypothetical protein BHW62_04920 [Acinetobacter sp. CAG:196_36_41]|nr:MAG: hypothetical protein BHW62_04920 [Acinetobacter sp. CAG:196_36_41]
MKQENLQDKHLQDKQKGMCMTNIVEQKQLLENFICDKELKELEQKFDKFNIFDCLRLTRTEIRHSNFLAWLLDPNETHGLSDYFLKEFLKKIIINNKKIIETINEKNIKLEAYNSDNNEMIVEHYFIPSVFDIDCWSMQNTEILREHENIDLLIVDETNKFVFVIENKVDTCQHDNQLTKYRTYVDEHYPSEQYKKLYVYLKPQSEKVELPYIYVSYSLIKEILDEIIKDKKLNNEVMTSIEHYKYIIERDFMQKDEISEICRKIYKKHKKAIELINKYSDTKTEMLEILKETLEEYDGLNISAVERNGIICLPDKIENLEKLKFSNWEPDDYIIHLHFMNCCHGHKDLCLGVLFGPTKNNNENSNRNDLIKQVEEKLEIKINAQKSDWSYSTAISILTIDQFYEYKTREEVKKHITQKIDDIKAKYIDTLREALNSWNF